MDEKANGETGVGVDFGRLDTNRPFFREFSPFVFEKIPLDSSKTRCFFFLPAADWLTPQRTGSSARNATSTSDVDLLTGFDPVTTGFPLSRGPRRRRDTLLVADARVDKRIVMAAIARRVAPARRRPPQSERRAARAGPSACPPPGRPPPSLSALAAARVATSAVRASSDDARRSRSATSFPASIARRVPTRLVLPIPRSLRIRRWRPPRSTRVPAGRDRGRSDRRPPARFPSQAVELASSPSDEETITIGVAAFIGLGAGLGISSSSSPSSLPADRPPPPDTSLAPPPSRGTSASRRSCPLPGSSAHDNRRSATSSPSRGDP